MYLKLRHLLMATLFLTISIWILILCLQLEIPDFESRPDAEQPGQMETQISKQSTAPIDPKPETWNPAPLQWFNGQMWDLPSSAVILLPVPNAPRIGIGDQLYRYAYAYTAARDLNTTLYILQRRTQPGQSLAKFGANDREFALDHFYLDSDRVQYIDEATLRAIPQWRTVFVNELGPWRPHQLPRDRIVLLPDLYQSELFFGRYKDELLRQYSPPRDSVRDKARVGNLIHQIEQSESVAVHVRRGDFRGPVHSQQYRVLPIAYQIRAIELVQYILSTRRERDSDWAPVSFFVFSDDIEYARREMAPLHSRLGVNLIFVSDPNPSVQMTSIEELELMCMCKHNIIANSGFSWWTAWLNRNPSKLVVAPFPRHRYRFYGRGPIAESRKELYWNHTYPPEWLTLNPYADYGDMM